MAWDFSSTCHVPHCQLILSTKGVDAITILYLNQSIQQIPACTAFSIIIFNLDANCFNVLLVLAADGSGQNRIGTPIAPPTT